MKLQGMATITLVLALAACGSTDPAGDSGAANNTTAVEVAPCQDAGARLPGTGLCASYADKVMLQDSVAREKAPEGCTWTINEIGLSGSDYLLYRALQCGENRTQLEYAPGTTFAELRLTKSAYGPMAEEAYIPVKLRASKGTPADAVTAIVRSTITDPAEARTCTARRAGIESWPSDALVVDLPESETAQMPTDEIRSACGPYGLDQGSQRYWRVVQGYAWFFDLGQDQPEIDPGSLTVMRKASNGEYQVYTPPAR